MTLKKPKKFLAVFCGSTMGNLPIFEESAAHLGKKMAEANIGLIYGGGQSGLMGVLARSVMSSGGVVTGIITKHLEQKELANHDISQLIIVENMHERKKHMYDLTDAFCIFPGGIGTLDEGCEVLTWKQIGLHHKPIILANIAHYWDCFIKTLDNIDRYGFTHSTHKKLYYLFDNVSDIISFVQSDLKS
jgi:uncharacterized protein (TIGR00730 family)